MQTITVAKINQAKIEIDQFVRKVRAARVRREVKAGENGFEQLDVPLADKLNSQPKRLKGLATAVIRRKRVATIVDVALIKGFLQRTEAEESIEDFTRVWIGHKDYLLFCFMSGFPGGTYPNHRLIVARSLTQDKLEADQRLVSPIGYDLLRVRNNFGTNLWDQNFKRKNAITKGRIQGHAMELDPLFPHFPDIGTFIGIEIPTEGKQERVKVFSDGRLQFMGLQPPQLEDSSTRDESLQTVLEVIDKLAPCEV